MPDQNIKDSLDSAGGTLIDFIISMLSEPSVLGSIGLAWVLVYFLSHYAFIYKVPTESRFRRKSMIAAIFSVASYYFFSRNMIITSDERLDASIMVSILAVIVPASLLIAAKLWMPKLAAILAPDDKRRETYKQKVRAGELPHDETVIIKPK